MRTIVIEISSSECYEIGVLNIANTQSHFLKWLFCLFEVLQNYKLYGWMYCFKNEI